MGSGEDLHVLTSHTWVGHVTGADVATTASYQASYEGFERAGYNREETTQLLRHSISLACQARDTFWTEYEGSAKACGPCPIPSDRCYQQDVHAFGLHTAQACSPSLIPPDG
jgi:S-methylmethionine-dependent homocysteine/selenocysteine methylase